VIPEKVCGQAGRIGAFGNAERAAAERRAAPRLAAIDRLEDLDPRLRIVQLLGDLDGDEPIVVRPAIRCRALRDEMASEGSFCWSGTVALRPRVPVTMLTFGPTAGAPRTRRQLAGRDRRWQVPDAAQEARSRPNPSFFLVLPQQGPRLCLVFEARDWSRPALLDGLNNELDYRRSRPRARAARGIDFAFEADHLRIVRHACQQFLLCHSHSHARVRLEHRRRAMYATTGGSQVTEGTGPHSAITARGKAQGHCCHPISGRRTCRDFFI
jgi:hypothetical protein